MNMDRISVLPDKVTLIEPESRTSWLGLAELREFGPLIRYLAQRDIKGRYRPTSIGRMWMVLRPVLEMLIYVVIFGFVFGISTAEIPYPLHVYSGIVVFVFFSGSLSTAAKTLTSNRHLLNKIYFPRLILPVVNTTVAIADLAAASLVVFLLMLAYAVLPGLTILALPVVLSMLLALTFGLGLCIAALSVYHSDTSIWLPLSIRALLYASPITYPVTLLPETIRPYYMYNPFAVIVELFRWCLFGTPLPDAVHILCAAALSGLALLAGLVWFRRVERGMIDYL